MRFLEPLYDRLIVRRVAAKKKTETGRIYMSDRSAEEMRPFEGTVLVRGSGKLLDNGDTVPIRVQPGDTVLYARYAGFDTEIDGFKVTVLREDELLGVIRTETEEDWENCSMSEFPVWVRAVQAWQQEKLDNAADTPDTGEIPDPDSDQDPDVSNQ